MSEMSTPEPQLHVDVTFLDREGNVVPTVEEAYEVVIRELDADDNLVRETWGSVGPS